MINFVPVFRRCTILLLLALIPLTMNSSLEIWGFYAHRRINHFAVFTLPADLFGFYKLHIDEITENAVNPDKRRYAVKGEAPRHYIDIDHYTENGGNPFEVVPRRWKDAVEKFSEDTLQEYGIIPWHIDRMLYWLTTAFQEQDVGKIVRLSADLGHYIGDSNVPLHTTKNYNGQLTGQYGIHGLWESRLPELFDFEYDFFAGKAEYVANVQDYAWEMVEQSHWAVDSVLSMEKELSQTFPPDRQYAFEERGRTLTKVYSKEYAEEYHRMLDGMVERQMRKTIASVGSLWFTAWVNAGQPDLEGMKLNMESDTTNQELEEIDLKFKQSDKPIGRDFDGQPE